MDYKTIYLCGNRFNVPIRVADMKYIGILGTPKIKIRAQSQEELDAKHISFENVQLPWQNAPIFINCGGLEVVKLYVFNKVTVRFIFMEMLKMILGGIIQTLMIKKLVNFLLK